MLNRLVMIVLFCWSFAASGDTIVSIGFEDREVNSPFPKVGNKFQLPPGPATDQLEWILEQLAQPDTSISDINAHFSPAWLASISATETRDFIAAVRNSYPNAVVRDVVGVTPIALAVVIDTPGSEFPSGYLTLKARYTGAKQINTFGVGTFYGNVQYLVDQSLSMSAAADKFETLSTEPSLLVGRIGANNQCTATTDRNANVVRATGSVFKLWVMAGIAEAVKAGDVTPEQLVPLVASELALAGGINIEPLNTLFPVSDLAELMLGNSDNTATDLLHELAGRDIQEQAIIDTGVADPTQLTPFLSINEQFHLFFSIPLLDAQNYVSGTEEFQRTFLNDTIVPLGPVTATPIFNESLLIDGSWRASPMDICAAFASLRNLPSGSDALTLADRALGSSSAQPNVRQHWDRVWYKGGSLESGVNGLLVLVHAWMLERKGEDPYVVVAMSNNPTGNIDAFKVQSITGRILQLVAEG